MKDHRRMTQLDEAVRSAKELETPTGERQYVAWYVQDGRYRIVSNMPLGGEWYDADGIQHGGPTT